MKGCKNCPAYAKCTVTYRGSACAALRGTYGLDSDPEIITNADRIRAIDGSIKGLATYLAKDPKGKKRWGASRGLKKPEVKIYDHKITRKKAREMAADAESFAAALAKLYPNYRATEINPPKYSDYVAGVYLCAEMRRND